MDFDDLDAKPGCRLYDIVVYGCTGITGNLIAEHLDEVLQQEDAPMIKWAIAGRNKEKMNKMAKALKTEPGIMVADTDEDLEYMCEATTVVIAAAGPYLLCGARVVEACIKCSTHYVDVTGEIVYFRRMADYYHQKAKDKGIFIVVQLGYMSAAVDLSAYLLAKEIGPLKLFREYSFSPSGVRGGGSFFSGYSQFEHMYTSETKLLVEPFSLGGKRKCGVRPEDKDETEAAQDKLYPNLWVNTGFTGHPGVRVVRRTCELFEEGPEEDCVPYGEEILCGAVDCTFSKGQATLNAQMAKPPEDIRKIMQNAQAMEDGLMKGQGGVPGQGPPRETRLHCRTESWSVAQSEDGRWAHCHLDACEGYEFSAVASVAGAITIAQEDILLKPDTRGGVVTPGYAFHGSNFLELLGKYSWACGPGRKITYTVEQGELSVERLEAAVKQSDADSKAFQARLFKGEFATSELPELCTGAKQKKEAWWKGGAAS